MIRKTRVASITLCVIFGTLLFGQAVAAGSDRWPGTKVGEATPKIPGMPAVLAKNLANFDDMDFRVYTTQQWQDLHKSHSKDVIVHWPDGHTTQGIDKHIEDLKQIFTFAPDNRVVEHTVRFGTQDGEWTAVAAHIEGTFTKPMVLPDGKTVQPTGKAYRLPVATLGHWNKDGLMFEEYLFWDNAEFMKQLGIGQ